MDKNAPWNTDTGIYFGYGTKTTLGKNVDFSGLKQIRYVGDRHIVTVGPNGSGKSHRLLLPNLVELPNWSLLVVDPKGDLARRTMKHREKSGEVILLNPFDVLGLGSHGFNPIASLDRFSEDFPDDAMGLAEALIRVEGKEPHWSESAQDLICALIMYANIVLPHPTLGDVRQMLGQKPQDLRDMIENRTITYNRMNLCGMVQAAKLIGCDELIAKCARFSELNPENRELQSIISVALTQTRWLDSRPVRQDLRQGGFDFSRMKEKPVTIYLILPARRLMTHSTWLRLVITSVLQALMKEGSSSKVPVMLMLDEFAQLGHLPAIEQNLALMRGYGIKLWAVLQDLSQAEAIYDRRWESFLGNAGVFQSFAPQDVKTAEHLSRLSGVAEKPTFNVANVNAGADAQVGEGTMIVPLMLPQDFRNMDEGFSALYSHKAKGLVRSYMPYPTELEPIRTICGFDED